MTGMNITNATRKKALMSHYAGEEVDNIIDTLVIPAPAGNAYEYTVFRDALNTHFLPQMNTEYTIYEFRTRAQEQGETLDMYITELKKLAKFCNFQNLDRELKSQIIQNCCLTKLRTQSLENCDWTIKQVLDKGRAMELSERQAGIIKRGETSVNQTNKYTSKPKQQPWKGKEKPKRQPQTCGQCGNTHGSDIKNCPAYGQTCSKCKKINHYAKHCKTPPKNAEAKKKPSRWGRRRHARVSELEEDETQEENSEENYVYTIQEGNTQDDSSDEDIRYVYTLRAVSNKLRRTKLPRMIAKVNGTETEFIIDTGAGLNILDKNGFDNLQDKLKLDRTDIRARAYKSEQPITILGKFCAKAQVQEREAQATFYVTEEHDGSLLTCETAEALKLVTVDRKFLLAVDAEAETDPLYEGVGLLKDFSVKLHIDDSCEAS